MRVYAADAHVASAPNGGEPRGEEPGPRSASTGVQAPPPRPPAKNARALRSAAIMHDLVRVERTWPPEDDSWLRDAMWETLRQRSHSSHARPCARALSCTFR